MGPRKMIDVDFQVVQGCGHVSTAPCFITSDQREMSSMSSSKGVTIIELLVGIALGLIVIAGMSLLFVNNSRARSEIEKTSQQIENGRYASQQILEELHLAGYYGELNPTTSAVATPAALPDPCATSASNLTAAIALPIQGYDYDSASAAGSYPSGTSCGAVVTDLKQGSDILVIRRASTCVAGSTGCDAMDTTKWTYFQAALCSTSATSYVVDTVASNLTLTKMDCTTLANIRSYVTRIYFVTNNYKIDPITNIGDGIPTLKFVELGNGAFSNPLPLTTGIEQLQIEYGVTTNADEAPDAYTSNPSSYNGCAGAACQTNWRNVTTVKIHILARNGQPTTGFSDTKTYTLGRKSDGTSNVFGPYGDAFKRHVYTTVVRLNNVAGRYE